MRTAVSTSGGQCDIAEVGICQKMPRKTFYGSKAVGVSCPAGGRDPAPAFPPEARSHPGAPGQPGGRERPKSQRLPSPAAGAEESVFAGSTRAAKEVSTGGSRHKSFCSVGISLLSDCCTF